MPNNKDPWSETIALGIGVCAVACGGILYSYHNNLSSSHLKISSSEEINVDCQAANVPVCFHLRITLNQRTLKLIMFVHSKNDKMCIK